MQRRTHNKTKLFDLWQFCGTKNQSETKILNGIARKFSEKYAIEKCKICAKLNSIEIELNEKCVAFAEV